MIEPRSLCLFVPSGLKKFKLNLFNRIGAAIEKQGGQVVRDRPLELEKVARDVVPIVGCMPECTHLIKQWQANRREWIYWDRGYARRVFATHLLRAPSIEKSYYRWHRCSFQLKDIRTGLPDDRWKALEQPVSPWVKNASGHVVVALPTETYERFHGISGWSERIMRRLARITKRQIVVRDKESMRPLQDDLLGAHCLVAHGSIAAVEAVILGCPVFVDPSSAAASVGVTDLNKIEHPVYPERQEWLNSLSYSQFNETELVDGTLFKTL